MYLVVVTQPQSFLYHMCHVSARTCLPNLLSPSTPASRLCLRLGIGIEGLSKQAVVLLFYDVGQAAGAKGDHRGGAGVSFDASFR